MAQKKAQLLVADEFAKLVALQQLADLIVAEVRGKFGPVEIRREDSRAPGWDDITVLQADGNLEAWQVKRKSAPVDKGSIARLLRHLHSTPSIALGHYAVPGFVPVKGVGDLGGLFRFCERLAGKDIDMLSMAAHLNGTEREWLDFVAEYGALDNEGDPLDLDDFSALQLLRRLRVEILGGRQTLVTAISTTLRLIVDPPDDLRATLSEWLDSQLDAAARLRWQGIERRVAAFVEVPRAPVGNYSPTQVQHHRSDAVRPACDSKDVEFSEGEIDEAQLSLRLERALLFLFAAATDECSLCCQLAERLETGLSLGLPGGKVSHRALAGELAGAARRSGLVNRLCWLLQRQYPDNPGMRLIWDQGTPLQVSEPKAANYDLGLLSEHVPDAVATICDSSSEEWPSTRSECFRVGLLLWRGLQLSRKELTNRHLQLRYGNSDSGIERASLPWHLLFDGTDWVESKVVPNLSCETESSPQIDTILALELEVESTNAHQIPIISLDRTAWLERVAHPAGPLDPSPSEVLLCTINRGNCFATTSAFQHHLGLAPPALLLLLVSPSDRPAAARLGAELAFSADAVVVLNSTRVEDALAFIALQRTIDASPASPQKVCNQIRLTQRKQPWRWPLCYGDWPEEA